MISTLTGAVRADGFDYPKLRKHTDDEDLIVLFSSLTTGTVVHAGSGTQQRHQLGDYSNVWSFNSFVDLSHEEKIILQNSHFEESN